ncbi:MAG: hypothetical protein HY912_08875 [Desulfomonile tiedjei]|uniref:ATPase involved in chromosome partitioning n=1 Tax=Desulfomonile tiedjei TaxID=2358 RepID=A0A9D6V2J5_9BACT|nr:hypothetical protein [Desulfomonile tiedjei]
MCEIVAFTGGEGSPGRSFMAFNTAVTLGMMGFGVTMIEIGDPKSGVCAYFGLEPLHSCEDFALGNCNPKEAVVHCGENLDLIVQGSSSAALDRDKVGRLFTVATQLEKTDFLVVDAPEGVPDSLLPVVLAATELFAVVTPEQMADFRSFWFIRKLSEICGGKHIHAIIDRAPMPEISEIMCNRLEHDLGRVLGINMDCAWFVPEDPLVQEAARARLPFVTFAPASETSLRIMQLATAIELARRDRYQGKLRTILQSLLFDLQNQNLNPVRTEPKISPAEIRFLQRVIMEALNSEEIDSVNFKNVYDVMREIMEASQNFGFAFDRSGRSINAFQEAHFAS